MPTFRQTVWEHVEPGMTVLGRDGQPRLITSAERPTLHHYVRVNGVWELDPYAPCVVVEATEYEATLALLKAFPGTEIIES